MYIYKTTNNANGKIYIGQSTRIFKHNYLGSGTILLSAIKKYGRYNFSVELIEQCDNQDILNQRERYWIEYYDSTNDNVGYNICSGGQSGGHGWSHGYDKHTHLSIQRMSESISKRKRKPHSEETKRKMSESARGRTMSDISRERIRQSKLGNIPWNKGIPHNVNNNPDVKYALELKVYSKRRGKSFDEIYGEDRANEIRDKMKR